MESKSSFNLLGLIVVVVLITLLGFALFPATSSSVMRANMTAVGCRGRDIYVAITGANTEREPLGLPPVWPADPGLYTNTVPDDIAGMNFTNSTDYFWVLYDGPNLGTEEWSPYVAGFYFGQLAGAGVPAHSGSGPLLPENNMWTIAKNISEDIEDVVPILVTRNLAAESLAAKVTEADMGTRLYFDTSWKTPFSNKGAVFIRKGGGMFTVRSKYMTWPVIYNRQTFDANVDTNGVAAKFPLKYLTPTGEVTPSEATYITGAVRNKQSVKDLWEYASQALPDLISMTISGFVSFAFLYLIAFLISAVVRAATGIKSRFAGVGFMYWFVHWLAVCLYCSVIAYIIMGGSTRSIIYIVFALISLALAVLAQWAGCTYVKRRKTQLTEEVYRRALSWMLSAPLIILLIYVALAFIPAT